MKNSKLSVILLFFSTITIIVALSFFISQRFGGHTEKLYVPKQIIVSEDMTIATIASKNSQQEELIQNALKIKDSSSNEKTLKELGISETDASSKIQKALNFKAEEASKNVVLIVAKFILWAVFMTVAFLLLRKNKMSPSLSKYILLSSTLIFGVILGPEPNSMSTVKDMVSNFAIKGILFPPRIIALLVFLGIVVAANKFICGWACQLGTLQDFIFRLNRDSKDREGIFKQYKIPFYISNTIRIVFFILFTLVAFIWSFDIIEVINPFTIFKPAALTAIGIVFISILLISSLFIYRPWCHLFCPFGLLGWIVEKFSKFRIKVDSTTCINCKECTVACPTNAMKSILSKDKIKPDCFSCGTCINACPTKSITFDK
ncbi:4Fe-4S binding protein [Clostridium magnum]|uniref:Putative electron transport protein YccM n=1 Tax=Clostridium magnum DSM 2767 TaxID=1121326 RepID=A0A162TIJ2_9CLOT|nr:4Fe-4S binding protein [Clostridium magnum]KZL92690.1 putative electron transport protein YccM [Clostridium magnum DSM 2767]SHI24518.1 4Fe-4S binding domain-containing protein [Clostridium magnum DSM 2767]